MARYKKRACPFLDEIEEFFKLPQESFEKCDPIQWWAGRRAQFPNLSRLARDILSIPGTNLTCGSSLITCALSCLFFADSAVAVEHIFLGRQDTISLRHTSLKADTIHTLMLVKQHL